MRGEPLKGHLDLILLAVLADGPAYGYGLILQLRSRTDGALNLSEGIVYLVLHRLEEASFLQSYTVNVGARRRRLYALTEAGRDELERLKKEWMQFSAGIERLLPRPEA